MAHALLALRLTHAASYPASQHRHLSISEQVAWPQCPPGSIKQMNGLSLRRLIENGFCADCPAVLVTANQRPASLLITKKQQRHTATYKKLCLQRLIEDGFCADYPAVLVTAKGMPDLATRIFLHRLRRQRPGLPTYGARPKLLLRTGAIADLERSDRVALLALRAPSFNVHAVLCSARPAICCCASCQLSDAGKLCYCAEATDVATFEARCLQAWWTGTHQEPTSSTSTSTAVQMWALNP